MTPGERKRKDIFDVYTGSFKELLKGKGLTFAYKLDGKDVRVDQPIYVCPLCRVAFSESALSTELPTLTLEDNPPKSLGGKPVALTCKKCNNTYGTKLESGISQYLDDGAFIEEQEVGSTIEVRAVIDGPHMKAVIELVDAKTFNVHIREEDNKHVAKKFLTEFETKEEGAFEFHIRGLKSEAFNRACLKIAHVEAFRFFGYGYLMTTNAGMIIDTLQTKTERIPAHGRVCKVPVVMIDGLYFGKVESVRFFYVVFSLETKKATYKVGVIIPGCGEIGQQEYLNFDKSIIGKRMDFVLMSDFSYPYKPPHPNRYQFLWEEMIRADEAGEVFSNEGQ